MIASGGAGRRRARRRGARGRAGGAARIDPPRETRRGSRRCAASCAPPASPSAMPPELRAAIVQDAETDRVLMLAWMDDEALRRRARRGEAWFWSRSRQELWHKGATSGNTLAVEELRDDCDGDAILLRVRPAGPGVPHRLRSRASRRGCGGRSRRARRSGRRARTSPASSTAGRAAARRSSARRASRRRSPWPPRATSASCRRWPTSGSRATCALAARGLDPAAVEDELRRRAAKVRSAD